MAMDIEKLKKVIEIAKKGITQGERDNAEKIARKGCTELAIKYEDALAGRWPHKSAGFYDPSTRMHINVDVDGNITFTSSSSPNPNWNAKQQASWQDSQAAQSRQWQQQAQQQRMHSEADFAQAFARGKQRMDQQEQYRQRLREKLRQAGLSVDKLDEYFK